MNDGVHRAIAPERDRLLERDSELDAVRAAVGRAAAGDGAWIVVSGQAGIGKTELVRTALADAGAGDVLVAWAHGSEFERSFAFGVVRQLLEPLVRGASAEAGSLFAGAAELARAALESPGDTGTSQVPGEPDYATLHGLYWLCVN